MVLRGVGIGGVLVRGLGTRFGYPVWVPGWVPCRTLSEWGIGKVQGALLEGCYSPCLGGRCARSGYGAGS